jgi:hypothetical protein
MVWGKVKGKTSTQLDIKIVVFWYVTEIGWDGMDWIELAQDRVQWRAPVNMVMTLQVP